MTLYSQVPCPLSVCSPVNLSAKMTVLIPAPSTGLPGLSTEKYRCNSQTLLMEPNPCDSQLKRRRVYCEEWLQTSNCCLACWYPNVLLWDQLLKAPSSSQRTEVRLSAYKPLEDTDSNHARRGCANLPLNFSFLLLESSVRLQVFFLTGLTGQSPTGQSDRRKRGSESPFFHVLLLGK